MGMDWYDMIARKNGGYTSKAVYTVNGLSGEDVYKEGLIELLKGRDSVLDAGCGDGVFTLEMASYCKKIIGFDNSKELLKIAEKNLAENNVKNAYFVEAWTHGDFPFEDNQFDLIYCRRGPASFLRHLRILKKGGRVYGIHSAAKEKISGMLEESGLSDVKIVEYPDARMHFENENEVIKYLSGIPGNLDYTLPENYTEGKSLTAQYLVDGKFVIPQWRYIWSGIKNY